ncbi:MAG: YjgN family protein [Flavobacteriales bacterium]
MFATPPLKRLAFKGQGGDLFIVLLVNMLLTFITLGLYYPWAKARKLSWYYEHTELDGHPFHFHGKGEEMFKGFIKAIALLLLIYGTYAYGVYAQDLTLTLIGLLVMVVGLLLFIPLVIHGSFRYRSSRSSWRSVHFGYHGKLNELYSMCLRDGLLTLLTFGIYGAWFTINLRNYTLSNMRYGSSSFRYKGDGMDYFLLNLKGYILTFLTIGIYGFWWQRDLFNYYVDNLSWNLPDGRTLQFKSKATGGGFFALTVINLLLVIFTLGIGFAWAEVRTMRFVLDNIELNGDADLNAVVQTEQEHKNAMADDLGDLMDIGVFF